MKAERIGMAIWAAIMAIITVVMGNYILSRPTVEAIFGLVTVGPIIAMFWASIFEDW